MTGVRESLVRNNPREGEKGGRTDLSLPALRTPPSFEFAPPGRSAQPATPTSTLTSALSPFCAPPAAPPPPPAPDQAPVRCASLGPKTELETVVSPWEAVA